MNATITKGRRILAVLATTSTLLLPAVGASAAPNESAADRASDAQTVDAQRAEERDDERDAPRQNGSDADDRNDQTDEVTEDTDEGADNDGDTVANTPDRNGDDDNRHPSGKDKSEEPGGSGNQGRAQHDPDDDGRGPDRSNGGLDQPGGEGGVDRDDQDGNNGCGNDDDFEDDNEGLCLGRQDRGAEEEVEEDVEEDGREDCPAGQNMVDGECTTPRNNVDRGTDDETQDGVGSGSEDTDTPDMEPVTTNTPVFEVEEGVLGVVVTEDAPAGTTEAVLGAALSGEVAAAGTTDVSATLDGDSLAAADALPRTGAGLAGLAVLGLSALAGGTALSRRRS